VCSFQCIFANPVRRVFIHAEDPRKDGHPISVITRLSREQVHGAYSFESWIPRPRPQRHLFSRQNRHCVYVTYQPTSLAKNVFEYVGALEARKNGGKRRIYFRSRSTRPDLSGKGFPAFAIASDSRSRNLFKGLSSAMVSSSDCGAPPHSESSTYIRRAWWPCKSAT
jgi:hypothetical protein